ncbi:MAG TPA: ATP synthase F1 subunit gamma [bacterium]|nr:ATP synthase F1 subunit gamma [bacterium]
MASGKEIKARIKSVKNTGKITRAMELMSTVKMKKAQISVSEARPFAREALETILRSGSAFDRYADSVIRVDSDRVLMVVITSQKGLCGAYNVNVFKQVAAFVREHGIDTIDFVTLGRKGRDFVARFGGNIIADFSDRLGDSSSIRETKTASRTVQSLYASGRYMRAVIVANHYISAISQKVSEKIFLPFEPKAVMKFLETLAGGVVELGNHPNRHMMIEPDKETILEQVVPIVLDAIFHETWLEAKASEHASRMVAMKNAKDSAKKKVSALTLSYNKARQAAITKEVSEIVSGVESMKDIA